MFKFMSNRQYDAIAEYEEGYRNGMKIGKTLNPKIKQRGADMRGDNNG